MHTCRRADVKLSVCPFKWRSWLVCLRSWLEWVYVLSIFMVFFWQICLFFLRQKFWRKKNQCMLRSGLNGISMDENLLQTNFERIHALNDALTQIRIPWIFNENESNEWWASEINWESHIKTHTFLWFFALPSPVLHCNVREWNGILGLINW